MTRTGRLVLLLLLLVLVLVPLDPPRLNSEARRLLRDEDMEDDDDVSPTGGGAYESRRWTVGITGAIEVARRPVAGSDADSSRIGKMGDETGKVGVRTGRGELGALWASASTATFLINKAVGIRLRLGCGESSACPSIGVESDEVVIALVSVFEADSEFGVAAELAEKGGIVARG